MSINDYVLVTDVGDISMVALADHGRGAELVGFGGGSSLPSASFLLEGNVLVAGFGAAERAVTAPERAVVSPRQALEQGSAASVADTRLPMSRVYASVFAAVADAADRGRRPDRLLLVHPATWNGRELDVLAQAAAEARLPSAEFAAEPVAAAWHLAGDVAPGECVAVLVAGEGWIDSAVLRRAGTGFVVAGLPATAVGVPAGQYEAAIRQAAYELLAAIASAGHTPSSLKAIHVTGRSGYAPLVVETVAQILGVTPRLAPDRGTAAVAGAMGMLTTGTVSGGAHSPVPSAATAQAPRGGNAASPDRPAEADAGGRPLRATNAQAPRRALRGGAALPGRRTTVVAIAAAVVLTVAIATVLVRTAIDAGSAGNHQPPGASGSAHQTQGFWVPGQLKGSSAAGRPSAILPGHDVIYVISGEQFKSSKMTSLNPAANAVEHRINVGFGTSSIVLGPGGESAYLIGRARPASVPEITVTPFNVATDTLGHPILVPGYVNSGEFMAFGPGGKAAYVVTTGYSKVASDSSLVTPINTESNAQGRPDHVPGDIDDVAVTPDGRTIYVTNSGRGDNGSPGWIIPVNAATGKVGAEIPVGDNPGQIAMAPKGNVAYITNTYSSTVTPFNTATNTTGRPIPVGEPGEVVLDIAITPNGRTAYVVCSGSGNIYSGSLTPINTVTNTAGAPIPIKGDTGTVAITPDGRTAYVLSSNLSTSQPGLVTPVSTATNTAGTPIAVGWDSYGIAITPDSKTAYVDGYPTENSHVGAVVPINVATNTAGHPITVGGYLSDIEAIPPPS
jgi:DNA-binding beta-propeller fold protein YncE